MNLFHREKLLCEFDHEKFETYEDLVSHYRHVHHHAIVKCRDCGKEFIHEKDRLHHVREEHEKKMDYREHKDSYKKSKKIVAPQEELDENRRNFSDNF